LAEGRVEVEDDHEALWAVAVGFVVDAKGRHVLELEACREPRVARLAFNAHAAPRSSWRPSPAHARAWGRGCFRRLGAGTIAGRSASDVRRAGTSATPAGSRGGQPGAAAARLALGRLMTGLGPAARGPPPGSSASRGGSMGGIRPPAARSARLQGRPV
jgi:hypothetical protein